MKKFGLFFLIWCSIVFQQACKPDPREKVTFKVGGVSFTLNTLNGIAVSTHPGSLQVGSSVFDKTIVTKRGRGQSMVAALEFVLLHLKGQPVPDVYQIVNRQADLEHYLASHSQACNGWLSKAYISDTTTGAIVKSGRDPMGVIQVTRKENNVFAINFDGFFTIFNDDINGGNFSSSVHVESTALVQVFD